MTNPSAKSFDIIIVGGGHGGGYAAMQLRRCGFEGSVALISNEEHLPYQRPPLSKDYLLGKKTAADLYFRSPEKWQGLNLTTLLNTEVTSVNRSARSIEARNGARFSYGKLIWAAGGKARDLRGVPGGDSKNVHTIRTLRDVDALIPNIDAMENVVIIGAGYIGLEAAAVFRGLGKTVSVIEAQEKILARVSAPDFSDHIQAYHEDMGTDFIMNTSVNAIKTRGDMAVAVVLADGREIPADCIIVGIGIIPAIAPLVATGLGEEAGIRVNDLCQSDDDDIYAIGDCALFECAFADGAWSRVESVQNAQDQATALAKTLTGAPTPYHAVPTFWSDQYDLKIQTVGISRGYTSTIVRGDEPSSGLSVLYFRGDLLIAVDTVNNMRDSIQSRKLVNTYKTNAPERLADTAQTLKELTATPK